MTDGLYNGQDGKLPRATPCQRAISTVCVIMSLFLKDENGNGCTHTTRLHKHHFLHQIGFVRMRERENKGKPTVSLSAMTNEETEPGEIWRIKQCWSLCSHDGLNQTSVWNTHVIIERTWTQGFCVKLCKSLQRLCLSFHFPLEDQLWLVCRRKCPDNISDFYENTSSIL